ncbi:hypothetical protein [Crateriforma conspicua]|uniref:hypothetical protein n=1 Tax=Crateriforma conspicua TaxID=2527996 RepID=UPI0011A18F7D|nr:hypothetical protein [Crateriforma conspicua]
MQIDILNERPSWRHHPQPRIVFRRNQQLARGFDHVDSAEVDTEERTTGWSDRKLSEHGSIVRIDLANLTVAAKQEQAFTNRMIRDTRMVTIKGAERQ